MIISELYLTNYCHHDCEPLMNIMLLPENEAFARAAQLAKDHPDTTSFYRFSDFVNYYQLRQKSDRALYDSFVALGGKPALKHPLSFVLGDSSYLDEWFSYGKISRIHLSSIADDKISFTRGDSVASFQRTGTHRLLTKQMLLDDIQKNDGSVEGYLVEQQAQYHYIEAQVWIRLGPSDASGRCDMLK